MQGANGWEYGTNKKYLQVETRLLQSAVMWSWWSIPRAAVQLSSVLPAKQLIHRMVP